MAVNSTFYLDAADLTSATAVYLDISLANLSPDGFYSDGDTVRQQLDGFLLPPDPCNCGTLSLAYRSISGSTTYSSSLCLGDATQEFRIQTASSTFVITTGDRAFGTTDPPYYFNGANKYYKAYLALATEDQYYICKIDNLGYITVMINCPVIP